MEIAFHLLGIYFALTLVVWLRRGLQALKTLQLAPTVKPVPVNFPQHPPLVSILVPAKNEGKNIRDCIDSLQAQDYPKFEIIVVNDNSTDQTEEILKTLGAVKIPLPQSQKDPAVSNSQLKYLNSAQTPEGWTGKNFALHQGVQTAKGSWLLFTDADTRHEPSGLSASITHALAQKLSLLTLLPRCLTGSVAESVIQPTAMGLMGLWFPITKINDPESPVYFGNGQYLLVEKKFYDTAGGHEGVKGAFLEDFALMGIAKQAKARAQCAVGVTVYGTRMYDSFMRIWRGWRRIYQHAFRNHGGILAFQAVNVFVFSVLPFVLTNPWNNLSSFLVAGPSPALLVLTMTAQTLILLTAWKTYEILRAKKGYALLHPVAAFVITLILLDAAWRAWSGKKTTWR